MQKEISLAEETLEKTKQLSDKLKHTEELKKMFEDFMKVRKQGAF